MTTTPSTFSRRDPQMPARLVADRRRYRRVHVDLLGRFMRADKQEFSCRMYDISIGGCALLTQSPVPVEPGEKVIAYFDQLGRLEGPVARIFDGGFAMTLQASIHKREKLCATLTWLVNKSDLPGIDERRHDRNAPTNDTATSSSTKASSCPARSWTCRSPAHRSRPMPARFPARSSRSANCALASFAIMKPASRSSSWMYRTRPRCAATSADAAGRSAAFVSTTTNTNRRPSPPRAAMHAHGHATRRSVQFDENRKCVNAARLLKLISEFT